MSIPIDAQQLVLAYGSTEAVRGVTLRVEPGRCHALFGRNVAEYRVLLLVGSSHIEQNDPEMFEATPRRVFSASF